MKLKVYASPSGELHSFSLEEKLSRLAAAYKKGRRFLAIPSNNRALAVEWILATFQSPMAALPIDENLPAGERARLLSQLPENSVIEIPDLPEGGPASYTKDENEIWAVIFTSGSSGLPKGVALTGAALKASAAAHEKHNGRSAWLLNLPLHHIGGFSVVSRAFFSASPIALAKPGFSPEETLAWIRSGLVEGLSLVPTTLKRLIRISSEPGGFSRLKTVLLGGAPSESDLVKEALRLGLPIRRTYGLTENASQVATESEPEGGLKSLPGVEVRIAGDGEILIHSPSLALGYFQQRKLEPLAQNNGFFPTGDLGEYKEGKLQIAGRKSDLIISGGVNIFPAEIESILQGCPALEDAAVCSVPDPEWGEAVCLGYVGSTAEGIREHLKGKLDSKKFPKRWAELAEIPRSPTGKVLRADLQLMVKQKLGL